MLAPEQIAASRKAGLAQQCCAEKRQRSSTGATTAAAATTGSETARWETKRHRGLGHQGYDQDDASEESGLMSAQHEHGKDLFLVLGFVGLF